MSAQQCSRPDCITIASEDPRWADVWPSPLCDRHLQAARRHAGLCANCGGERERQPVMNSLTGKQLRRRGQPAWQHVCKGCGRRQSEYAKPTHR